jgi:CheY-like chemotaxis protein
VSAAIHYLRRSRAAMPRSGASFAAPSHIPPVPGGYSAANHRRPSSRILLAFHEISERDLLAALLTRYGFAIDCCENGLEALALVAVRAFALVVTGMSMPGMDGLELIGALDRRRPGLPVIAITKGADDMDRVYRRSALLFGAAGAHSLPLQPELFLADVEQAMRTAPNVGQRNSVVPIGKGGPPCESGFQNASHARVSFEGARD